MENEFNIKLKRIISTLKFETLFIPETGIDEIKVSSHEVSRLGLEIIGSAEFFDNKRLLLMGRSENAFLESLDPKKIRESVEKIFMLRPPAFVISNAIKKPNETVLQIAREHDVSVLVSHYPTAETISEIVSFLSLYLAPRITRSGGLMNVHGEGVLIVGESGVGKSETEIELLKRGHKLITDDIVEIRKISKNVLMGSGPENVRHFIEVRGIGIINARKIFGIGAIKLSERIDVIVNLESWKENKIYDRLGMMPAYTEVLGIKVPYLTIPVRPGRNLAVIIEVAAMHIRQKKLGYNAAVDLFENLGINNHEDLPYYLADEK